MSRSANFTHEEKELLIDTVIKYKHIIENKKTNASTQKDKNQAWDHIALDFSANGTSLRTAKTLKGKYESIQKALKKKCAEYKSDASRTGGGIANAKDLQPFEERVLAITQLSTMGMEPAFDNDACDGKRIK